MSTSKVNSCAHVATSSLMGSSPGGKYCNTLTITRRRREEEDSDNLTIIELTMWNDVAGWQPTPTTADVTVTKIAGYVHVRILMNQ